MGSKLENAFNFAFKLQAYEFTFKDTSSGSTYTIKAAPANFFRDFAGPEEVSFRGREYVLSNLNLIEAGFTDPVKKNDRLINPSDSLDYKTIEEVREMRITGTLVGYRVRTN